MSPAGLDGVGYGDSVYTLESVDHVEDAVAVAGAEVVDGEATLPLDGFEGADVPVGEVDDVDVVAHAGAVRGGVVVAEDAEAGAFADGNLGDVGHEVVWDAVWVFTNKTRFVGANWIEIAKEGCLKFRIGICIILHDFFNEILRAAVWVG